MVQCLVEAANNPSHVMRTLHTRRLAAVWCAVTQYSVALHSSSAAKPQSRLCLAIDSETDNAIGSTLSEWQFSD
jgi:hypothetical protein